MDKKVFVKVSERLYKDLMKNPNWKAYEIGLNDGREQGSGESELKGSIKELKRTKLLFKSLVGEPHKDCVCDWCSSNKTILKIIEKRLKELESKGVN